MLPDYSLHVAQNPIHTQIKEIIDVDSDINVLDTKKNDESTDQHEHKRDTLQMAVHSKDDLSDIPIIYTGAQPSRLPPTIRPIDTANASLPATMSKN